MAELAWAYASTNNDEEILVDLAQRSDLPRSIVGQIAGIPAVPVRVAYLSRPDLDPGERDMILAAEKRGTVLALLAGDPNCDHDTLDALATHKVIKVTVALVGNEGAPTEIRRKAALHIGTTGASLNGNQHSVWGKFVQADTEGHDAYANAFPQVSQLELLLGSTSLGEAALRRVFTELVELSMKTYRETDLDWSRDNAIRALMSRIGQLALNPVLPDDVAARMEAMLDEIGTRARIVDRETFDRVVKRVDARRRGTLGTDLTIAATSTDPAELDALVHDTQDPAVLGTVVNNRAASPATTARAYVRHNGTAVLARRRDQHDVIHALWVAEAFEVLNSWTPRDDAEIALGVRMLADPNGSVRAKRSLAQRMASQRKLPPEAVGYLPLEIFANSYLGEPLRDLAVDLVVRSLHDKPVASDVLLTMSANFESSLDDLLELGALLNEPTDTEQDDTEQDDTEQTGTGIEQAGTTTTGTDLDGKLDELLDDTTASFGQLSFTA